MLITKSVFPLMENQKLMIVSSLFLSARKICNRYESEMYKMLAKKILYMERNLELDGLELTMISLALNEEADRCKNEGVAQVHRTLALNIMQEKKKFHRQAYAELSPLYLFSWKQ